MNAIILKEPGKFEIGELFNNTFLNDDEVLLKVHKVGICGTDLHAYMGNQPFFSYPRILGHELGVEVIEKGKAVKHVSIGDKCSVEPYFNVGSDQAVRMGKTNCGENLSVLGVHQDGGMREYIKLPARYVHKSEILNYDQLALIEPLGIGCHAINRANIQPDDKVLVIGAGPIGLAAMQFAILKNVFTVAMDINSDRLQFCKAKFLVNDIINAKSSDILASIKEIFNGDLPTVILDATGNENSMRKTFDLVAPGGKIIFIGLFLGNMTFYDPLFHKKEITLMASRNALASDFKQIITQMEAGLIDINPWITHRIAFSELPNQFPMLLKPEHKVVKAMVEF